MTNCLASEVIDGKRYLAVLGSRDVVWVYEWGSSVGHRTNLSLIVMASYLWPSGALGKTVADLLQPILQRYASGQLHTQPLPASL
ncbi:hypothetical protein [Aquitalea palustris]|uniref:hypothetical protein n=1 Tax=Aquitalea palustris TaxID=2480983 RepID=UPI001CF02343|nr:hypothetical protein [Aquitalea palustris]